MSTLTAPYVAGSETSEAAAKAIKPSTATLRYEVLEAIRFLNGATDEQIQEFTGFNPSTSRPRRVELVRMGLVKDSGETRNTSSGRKATFWVVA